MNQEQFDKMTRMLASDLSRRQALKILGGSIFSSALALFGITYGEAQPRPIIIEDLTDDVLSALPIKELNWYTTAKQYIDEIYNRLEEFIVNRQDCLNRGFSDDLCSHVAAMCEIQDTILDHLLPHWVQDTHLLEVFKTDCGNGQCFQCCYVPGSGCHTSFIGFPVLNCNELYYGAGTRPAGITLLVDPNAQPGDICLFIRQTCQHISLCHIPSQANHDWLTDPRAITQRGRVLIEQILAIWKDFKDFYSTILHSASTLASIEQSQTAPMTQSVLELEHFITGRGRSGWRAELLADGLDWQNEAFRVTDPQGHIVEPASRHNAVLQLGLLRVVAGVPNLAQRLAYVESRVWTDSDKQSYLAQIADPDSVLLEYISPYTLELLKRVWMLQDYRLLAVPLPGEPSYQGIFDGIRLGQPPIVRLSATAGNDTTLVLQLAIEDPEETMGDPDRPVAIDWGDGQVTQHALPVGQDSLMETHMYGSGGTYLVCALVENNTGLRGLAAIVIKTEGLNAAVTASNFVPSLAAISFPNVGLSGLQLNNSVSLTIALRDSDGHEYTVGLSSPISNTNSASLTVLLGDIVAHNLTRLPIKTIVVKSLPAGQPPANGTFSTTFSIAKLIFSVFATAKLDYVSHTISLTPSMLRVFLQGSTTPLPESALTIDVGGNINIPILRRQASGTQTEFLDRVEIDITTAMFAGFTLGDTLIPYPVGTAGAWVETRPGKFVKATRTTYLPLMQR